MKEYSQYEDVNDTAYEYRLKVRKFRKDRTERRELNKARRETSRATV